MPMVFGAGLRDIMFVWAPEENLCKRDIIDSAIYFIEDKYQDFVSEFHDSVLGIIDQNFYRNVQEASVYF